MIAYLIVWRCECTQFADTTGDLPERCPGHDEPAIYPNSTDGRTWQQVDAHPGQPRGHQCSDLPWVPACPGWKPEEPLPGQLDLFGAEP